MNAKNRGPVRTAMRLGRLHQGVRAAGASLFVLAATVGVCSCAVNEGAEGPVVWHDGMVLAIVAKGELNAAVPTCTSRSGTAPWTDEARVAVVRSRVGKGAYDEAFLLGAMADVRAGDTVGFDRRGCILRQTRQAEAP
jgi:hypothetical protein